MTARHIKVEATAFRIWRVGHPLGWNCTVREVVDETGLTTDTVRRVCRERGWPIEAVGTGNNRSSHPYRLDVVTAITFNETRKDQGRLIK